MLVLTGKPGMSITIGDDIVIHFVRVRGQRCRLGIVAPRAIQVAMHKAGNDLLPNDTAGRALNNGEVRRLTATAVGGNTPTTPEPAQQCPPPRAVCGYDSHGIAESVLQQVLKGDV